MSKTWLLPSANSWYLAPASISLLSLSHVTDLLSAESSHSKRTIFPFWSSEQVNILVMVTGASEDQRSIQRTVEEMQQELNKNKYYYLQQIQNTLVWSSF